MTQSGFWLTEAGPAVWIPLLGREVPEEGDLIHVLPAPFPAAVRRRLPEPLMSSGTRSLFTGCFMLCPHLSRRPLASLFREQKL